MIQVGALESCHDFSAAVFRCPRSNMSFQKKKNCCAVPLESQKEGSVELTREKTGEQERKKQIQLSSVLTWNLNFPARPFNHIVGICSKVLFTFLVAGILLNKLSMLISIVPF